VWCLSFHRNGPSVLCVHKLVPSVAQINSHPSSSLTPTRSMLLVLVSDHRCTLSTPTPCQHLPRHTQVAVTTSPNGAYKEAELTSYCRISKSSWQTAAHSTLRVVYFPTGTYIVLLLVDSSSLTIPNCHRPSTEVFNVAFGIPFSLVDPLAGHDLPARWSLYQLNCSVHAKRRHFFVHCLLP
jgi:hypothetical protein